MKSEDEDEYEGGEVDEGGDEQMRMRMRMQLKVIRGGIYDGDGIDTHISLPLLFLGWKF